MTPHTGAFTEKAKNRLSQDCFDVWNDFIFKNIVKHPIKVW
jgi:hypothetical protein